MKKFIARILLIPFAIVSALGIIVSSMLNIVLWLLLGKAPISIDWWTDNKLSEYYNNEILKIK